jgi:hypothetical protein
MMLGARPRPRATDPRQPLLMGQRHLEVHGIGHCTLKRPLTPRAAHTEPREEEGAT